MTDRTCTESQHVSQLAAIEDQFIKFRFDNIRRKNSMFRAHAESASAIALAANLDVGWNYH